MLSISSLESRVHKSLENKNYNTVALQRTKNSLDLLHRRLGHNIEKVLKIILSNCNIYSQINKSSATLPSFFQARQYGKSHRFHFRTTETKTTKPLEVIHTDLWGASPVPSKYGHRYYVSFVDDWSRYTWIYPLVSKSDTFKTFIFFKEMIKKKLERKIKAVQSDIGGEFKIPANFFKTKWNRNMILLPLYP